MTEKILTKNINNENSQSIDSYMNAGGYAGLKKSRDNETRGCRWRSQDC